MAKKSKIEKDKRQRQLVELYAERRAQLKKAGDYAALAKLPKDASPTSSQS